MQDIWKDIPGYEGHYQASTSGKIRSTKFFRHNGVTRELKQQHTYDGYCRVALTIKNVQKSVTVHILVAKTFIPNPENKSQVNHIDGNKDNNSVSNLEWVTPKQNIQHSIKLGLRHTELRQYPLGGDHYASKPIYQYDFSGNLIKKWDCVSEAARYYSCNPCTIINCSKGRIKSCKGYMWRSFSENAPQKIDHLVTKDYPRIIVQKALDGTVIKEWNGYKELLSSTNYRAGDICMVCKGKQKTAFGYIWEEKPIPYS
jgi:hypothetical protein